MIFFHLYALVTIATISIITADATQEMTILEQEMSERQATSHGATTSLTSHDHEEQGGYSSAEELSSLDSPDSLSSSSSPSQDGNSAAPTQDPTEDAPALFSPIHMRRVDPVHQGDRAALPQIEVIPPPAHLQDSIDEASRPKMDSQSAQDFQDSANEAQLDATTMTSHRRWSYTDGIENGERGNPGFQVPQDFGDAAMEAQLDATTVTSHRRWSYTDGMENGERGNPGFQVPQDFEDGAMEAQLAADKRARTHTQVQQQQQQQQATPRLRRRSINKRQRAGSSGNRVQNARAPPTFKSLLADAVEVAVGSPLERNPKPLNDGQDPI